MSRILEHIFHRNPGAASVKYMKWFSEALSRDITFNWAPWQAVAFLFYLFLQVRWLKGLQNLERSCCPYCGGHIDLQILIPSHWCLRGRWEQSLVVQTLPLFKVVLTSVHFLSFFFKGIFLMMLCFLNSCSVSKVASIQHRWVSI